MIVLQVVQVTNEDAPRFFDCVVRWWRKEVCPGKRMSDRWLWCVCHHQARCRGDTDRLNPCMTIAGYGTNSNIHLDIYTWYFMEIMWLMSHLAMNLDALIAEMHRWVMFYMFLSMMLIYLFWLIVQDWLDWILRICLQIFLQIKCRQVVLEYLHVMSCH